MSNLPRWHVDFVSGSYVDSADVYSQSVYGAIEMALAEFEDAESGWPSNATEATIVVRRIEK